MTSAWALGEIQDKRAIETLAKVLVSDEQSEVRKTTAWALREIQSSQAKYDILYKDAEVELRLEPHMKGEGDCASCHTSKEVDIESLKKSLALKWYFKELANKDTTELESKKLLLETVEFVDAPSVKADIDVTLGYPLKMKPRKR